MGDLLSSIRGLSYSLAELYAQISQCGWELKKLSYDSKRDKFLAKGKASHGEEIEAWGPSEKVAVANLLMHIVHRNGLRSSKVSMWTTDFVTALRAIAEAFSKAPLYEPKAAIAFQELGRDSVRRAEALRDHLEIVVTNNPEPYKSPEKMCDDIRKRRRLEVSRAGIDHPLWSAEEALAFRITHDVFGYCASGGGWDWEGENQAFAAHCAILPVEAQKALFTESVAKTAYATYYRAYGPHKIALFPEFMDRVQERENPHQMWQGIHPSQMIAPIPRPRVKPLVTGSGVAGLDLAYELGAPQNGSQRVSGAITDPNANWSSGYGPLPLNARADYRDEEGLDPLQAERVVDNAKLIDTEWAYLNQEDPADLERMKEAVTNAFRAVLLSPRKDLRWNAVHYQDISHIPGNEDDPTFYWNTLERARQNWNVARHGEDARFAHMPYYSQWKSLEHLMYQKNPHAGWPAAIEAAQQFLFRMQTRVQNQVMAEDADKPEEKQRDMYAIELEANKRLTALLKTYIGEHQLGFDIEAAVAPGQTQMEMDVPQVEMPDKSRYGAFMGTHIQAIAQISEHVDEIMKAALEDVHDHQGTGWHFRASVLRLGIAGVGPKVCSFAWLLLQPMTSQLATIDTHMMDVLGHHFEKDMSPRDYFKFERQLAAGRDAAGYAAMPLGIFQWGQWDYKRTGPGTHQDHSALRVLDPTPHEAIDWQTKEQPIGAAGALEFKENWRTHPPDWWAATQEARDQVGRDWDKTVAPNIPKGQIPYVQGAPPAVYAKTAETAFTGELTPFFYHPVTGVQVTGAPGQTLMHHIRTSLGMTVPEVWQQMQDQHVGKT